MKKTLSLVILIAMAFGFVSCAGEQPLSINSETYVGSQDASNMELWPGQDELYDSTIYDPNLNVYNTAYHGTIETDDFIYYGYDDGFYKINKTNKEVLYMNVFAKMNLEKANYTISSYTLYRNHIYFIVCENIPSDIYNTNKYLYRCNFDIEEIIELCPLGVSSHTPDFLFVINGILSYTLILAYNEPIENWYQETIFLKFYDNIATNDIVVKKIDVDNAADTINQDTLEKAEKIYKIKKGMYIWTLSFTEEEYGVYANDAYYYGRGNYVAKRHYDGSSDEILYSKESGINFNILSNYDENYIYAITDQGALRIKKDGSGFEKLDYLQYGIIEEKSFRLGIEYFFMVNNNWCIANIFQDGLYIFNMKTENVQDIDRVITWQYYL